ncbi:hypothetical protein [Corynebacterium lowii]|uniref:Uncharacterized protein n=1 Tax=Corynebacterium lowii TaxID=1544413 RepID=A0A0Q0UFZ3_9CORY|nr:hypothetical protein [Corynebacterium lowii]KQB87095.1 hypothetical protein Clow_00143 [Corynebacterium lowii]MDP9852320.1 hypothetical protein [Corynebacterium lowii]
MADGIICVVYAHFPDTREPLAAFVETEDEARALDQELRAQGEGTYGFWEDFPIQGPPPGEVLYGLFMGDVKTTTEVYPWAGDPLCEGIFSTYQDAERATRPKDEREARQWANQGRRPLYVLPFRPGWKRDVFFEGGVPWPPDGDYGKS